MYVVCDESSTIEVYEDRPPYNRLNDIRCADELIQTASDLVSSPSSGCLYITDQDAECVWCILLNIGTVISERCRSNLAFVYAKLCNSNLDAFI